jgi:hypothetical protein
MTVLIENQTAGEFLVSEGNGAISRESGTLLSGQLVADGTVLVLAASKLRAAVEADFDTDGTIVGFAGIVVGRYDASATGTNADIKNVPYIARLAEVNDELVVYPEIGTDTEDADRKTAVLAAMTAVMIIAR